MGILSETLGERIMEVGERIKQTRIAKQLRQDDLAEKSGVAQGFISKIETGKAMPTLETLYRLADALGVQVSDFV